MRDNTPALNRKKNYLSRQPLVDTLFTKDVYTKPIILNITTGRSASSNV